MSKSATSFITRLCVFVVSMAFVGADLIVSAQNANSSTTTQEDMSTQNTNMSSTNMNSRGRRRRGRRRSSSSNMAMPNANAACGPMQENTNMDAGMQENTNAGAAASNTSMGGRRRRRGRRRGGNMNATDTTSAGMATMTPVSTGRCDPNAQEQTDLSGTYTGTVNYTEGGLSGDTALTVNGNDFTMTSGSNTQEGRIVAVTTCNYTAVTMMFGKAQTSATSGPQPPPLPAVSLRARRVGGGLTLESVGGETRQFSFTSAGTSGGGRRPRARRRASGGMMHPVGIKPPTAMSHSQ